MKMKADVETYHDVTSYSAPPYMGIFCMRGGGEGGGGKLAYLSI